MCADRWTDLRKYCFGRRQSCRCVVQQLAGLVGGVRMERSQTDGLLPADTLLDQLHEPVEGFLPGADALHSFDRAVFDFQDRLQI